jgi:hypothetical protein
MRTIIFILPLIQMATSCIFNPFLCLLFQFLLSELKAYTSEPNKLSTPVGPYFPISEFEHHRDDDAPVVVAKKPVELCNAGGMFQIAPSASA